MKWALIAVGVLVAVVALVAVIGMLLPKDHLASRRSRFHQPPEAVWAVIIGEPDWRPDIKGLEKLEPRDGHRSWKEIDKRGQAITYVSVEETPPRRLVTRIADPTLPFGGTWTQEIVPDSNGCVVTITEAGEIYNPIFRFMSRFVLGYTGNMDGYLKALHAKFGEAAETGA
jgi:hypothetical protein